MEKLAYIEGRLGVLGSDLVSIKHAMPGSGLFTDEALQYLIEGYPRRQMTLLAASPDPEIGVSAQHAGTTDLAGSQIFGSLFEGRHRLELQDIERHAPAYGEMIDRGFEDIERATPHLRTFARRSTLVISSANVVVPCSAAVSVVCKWQVRGRQRLHLYGMQDRLNPLPAARREALLRAARNARISYAPGQRPEGLVYGLGPGMAVSWPLNMPHCVENGEELSVSIVSEFVTPETKRTRDVYLVNGFLRRRLGIMPRSTSTEGLSAFFKRGLAIAVTGFGGRSPHRPSDLQAVNRDSRDF